jgi:hypothetical protein
VAIAFALGQKEIHGPKPSVVGVQEDASDAAVAVEDVIIFVLPRPPLREALARRRISVMSG